MDDIPRRNETTWVRYPVAAVDREGRIRGLGHVKLLPLRPLICQRCLKKGHARALCKGVNRSDMCYRRAEQGHKAATFSRTPLCPVCQSAGRPMHAPEWKREEQKGYKCRRCSRRGPGAVAPQALEEEMSVDAAQNSA